MVLLFIFKFWQFLSMNAFGSLPKLVFLLLYEGDSPLFLDLRNCFYLFTSILLIAESDISLPDGLITLFYPLNFISWILLLSFGI